MTPYPTDKTASIHLDYGADSADFNVRSLHVCPQGLRMKTRWYFEPGAVLSVNFQLTEGCADQPAHRLLKTEGLVAECQRDLATGEYLVTVIFLEVTEDILALSREVMVALALPN